MSLIFLTRDKINFGGIYLGAVKTKSVIHFGNGYMAGLCGVGSEDNTFRVSKHFETFQNLDLVNEGDIHANGRQYGFLTKESFIFQQPPILRPMSIMLHQGNTCIFGNTLIDDKPMFEELLSFIDASTLGVQEKLIHALKKYKRIGLDVRVTGQSCTDIYFLLGDHYGNLLLERQISNNTTDPIDLL